MKKKLLALLLTPLLFGCASSQKVSQNFEEAAIVEFDEEAFELSKNNEVIPLTVPPADDGTPLTQEEAKALDSPVILQQKDTLDLEAELEAQDKMAVELHFKYFTHRGRGSFERALERMEHYFPYIEKVFTQKNIPVEIGYLALVESGFNPNAISRAGAVGLWQFMPYTGKDLGLKYSWWIDERRDPYKATEAAAEYLLWLHSRYNNWYLAIAAYNAGPGKISRALDRTSSEGFFDIVRKNHTLGKSARLRLETKQYVPKFIAVVKIMRNLEALGFKKPDFKKAQDLRQVQVRPNVDLPQLARAVGLSWERFRELNPAFRRTVSPNNTYTTAYVPATTHAIALNYLRNPRLVARNVEQPSRSTRWVTYRVKKGDTLSEIAEQYNVSVASIRKNNRLSRVLVVGERIRIPVPATRYNRYVAQQSSRRGTVVHVVQKGDNLYDIAKRYSVTIASIANANAMRTNAVLRQGQKLYIPKKSIARLQTKAYTVRRGDTLWGIARKFNMPVDSLARMNKIRSNTVLMPGDVLKVAAQ